jgi:hypothetical protein
MDYEMDLNEAIAVYLYCQKESELAAWNMRIFRAAMEVIQLSAMRVIVRENAKVEEAEILTRMKHAKHD